jgi:very-short-patch-repair endonuclease
MRHEITEAERRLWSHLRDHQLDGWPFRRQHPIPPYIADFACIEARMIVEIDGGQHAESRRDERRDRMLSDDGWQVLRFWNNDVLSNTEGVLTAITTALRSRTPR